MQIFALILLVVPFTVSSKCPASRIPDHTDCTSFYNCVDLPTGGFLWIPGKCEGGLVSTLATSKN